MKTNEIIFPNSVDNAGEASLQSAVSVRAYYEMENQTVIEMSDLEVLNNQLQQLELLQKRSRFMMTEIAYLLKVE